MPAIDHCQWCRWTHPQQRKCREDEHIFFSPILFELPIFTVIASNSELVITCAFLFCLKPLFPVMQLWLTIRLDWL